MGHFRKTLRYAGGLLLDESGIIDWAIWIPLIVFGVNTAVGVFKGYTGKSAGKRAQRHAYERQMGFEYQQAMLAKEMDIEKIKELQKLNESRLEIAKASGFQQGSYAGPLFQVVSK